MSSKELNLNSEPLELSWELGRGSVLYADENFTVYISVKNISDKPLAIWDLGIMGCSDFYIKRYFLKMGSISGSPEKGIGKKLIKIICSIKNFWPNVHKECNIRKPPDIENHLSKEKKMIRARQDILKEHYYNQLQKGIKYLPWQLSPGETWSVNFDVETKNFLFFRPDKFKLNLFADYSNREYKYLFCWDKITGTDKKKLIGLISNDFGIDWIKDAKIELKDANTLNASYNTNSLQLKLNEAKSEVILVINGDKVDKFEVNEENGALNVYGLNGEEFGRVTKIEEIEILASIKSILSAGIAGAVLGSLARIFITNSDLSLKSTLSELFVAGIISIFAITALARRAGTQTIITIQDFWGGLFIGFMVGYAGHDFVDDLIGIRPGGNITDQIINSTNESIAK